MKRKSIAAFLIIAMIFSACGKVQQPAPTQSTTEPEITQTVPETPAASSESAGDAAEVQSADTPVENLAFVRTSFLGDTETKYYDESLVPQIAPYHVESDFSNVVYEDYFYHLFYEGYESSEESEPNALQKALIEKDFAVVHARNDEFFDIYESNRYSMFPSFITVDSLMHTYHLYFAHLMKTCEKEYLASELQKLSAQMLEICKTQYAELKGTDLESAAYRNLAFFAIGSSLQGGTVSVEDPELQQTVQSEVSRIRAAQGIEICPLTGEPEDYTQYKPRGYYEGDEVLEQYFRAMMWYGRIPYVLDDPDQVKSALLQTAAISQASEGWESIYNITSFFAGASDDPGFYEVYAIAARTYGDLTDTAALCDAGRFETFFREMQTLDPPGVNSIPVQDGDDPVIPSYRFMGQRFTVDAAIMQRLIYSAVKENAEGDHRMLPDALDTAAALGSKEALDILAKQGDTGYQGYTENLSALMTHFDNDDPKLWNASLYSNWLNTLRPLLEEKGEGYPSYMNSREWTRKNLETFTGSYAELKHDTILYAKQTMAEMGGGMEEEMDDRGYVDPQPVVYGRFRVLSEKTGDGLAKYGMLSDQAREDLDRLAEIASTLLSISEKELKNEALSEEDYEFIRCYGGYLEHFWKEASQDSYDGPLVYSYQAPCPIVADIATDPNGAVLEVGSGYADTVYVVFPIGDELHVGRGSVYSFYQFTVPLNERMTDSEWKNALSGGYLDEETWQWVEVENPYKQPEWTTGYRITYGY